jgi:hypothetical protein
MLSRLIPHFCDTFWMKANFGFSRRGPDNVAEEVARVLSQQTAYEFKALFLEVQANLKARNIAGGGEEMLRLRAYEKLQNLVAAGIVNKRGKEYRGVPAALASFFDSAAESNAKFASRPRTSGQEENRPAVLNSVDTKPQAPKRKVKNAQA